MKVRLSRCRGECGEQMAHSTRPPAGVRQHCARGLCRECYDVAHRDDQLAGYPPLMRDRDEVLDAFAALRDRRQVDTLAEAAARIGMSFDALEQVLARSRRVGDPRAVWKGPSWRAGMFGPLDARR